MKKKPYTEPVLEKQETMRIAEETIEKATGKLVCKQCSSCHGCR
jgi:cytochrome c2